MKKTTFILILFLTFGVKGQEIILQEFASGFGSPVEIVNAKDSRLFVVQQNGFIKINLMKMLLLLEIRLD